MPQFLKFESVLLQLRIVLLLLPKFVIMF